MKLKKIIALGFMCSLAFSSLSQAATIQLEEGDYILVDLAKEASIATIYLDTVNPNHSNHPFPMEEDQEIIVGQYQLEEDTLNENIQEPFEFWLAASEDGMLDVKYETEAGYAQGVELKAFQNLIQIDDNNVFEVKRQWGSDADLILVRKNGDDINLKGYWGWLPDTFKTPKSGLKIRINFNNRGFQHCEFNEPYCSHLKTRS